MQGDSATQQRPTLPAGDPPTVEEIIAVTRGAGDSLEGVRLHATIVMLRRARLRINEPLGLKETDLDPGRGSVLVRHGKGDKRREAQVGPPSLGRTSNRSFS